MNGGKPTNIGSTPPLPKLLLKKVFVLEKLSATA